MNAADTLKFFQELVNTKVPTRRTSGPYAGHAVYENEAATHWLTKARTALASVLPPSHPVVRQFEQIAGSGPIVAVSTFDQLRSTFRAAKEMLEEGRFSSLSDAVRAETEGEILDQALELLSKKHRAAAAVLAGGALETHLRALCVKHGLQWNGDGSISKYDGAIAQARNNGTEIYNSTDTKNVGAWGGLRNDAAHDPTTFNASEERVRMMIDNIREFIGRTR